MNWLTSRLSLSRSSSNLLSVRALKILLLFAALIAAAPSAVAGSSKVIKVLPTFLDREGRIARDPSLYARDAYQAHLRATPSLRSGLQFDVQWRARGAGELTLRIELRGTLGGKITTAKVEETVTHHGWFANWAKLQLTGDAWKKFGETSAWRATLWSGDKLVAEQKSFLW